MHPELQMTLSMAAPASIPPSKNLITGNDANGNPTCSPAAKANGNPTYSPAAKDETPSSQTPVKKPTRQWAAWTRQEEESFFNALRQVGKNFEKITSRVQSKNKDQVRHYYYRLIKRINKLLGPAFTLDAKNSKDANAAMLRWWSLLEKHSCSASKLHLKPRRFKTFVTALEHQLLKDRKKTKRKGTQAEQISPAPLVTVQIPSKAPGNVQKVATLESHSAQKTGTGRGNSLKRHSMTSTGGCKDEISSVKTTRQRRRAGVGSVSLSEYKRWEKAAIAGVSLVADAAAHLERTSNRFPSDGLLVELHSKTFSSSEGKLLNKVSGFGYNGNLPAEFVASYSECRTIQVQNTDRHPVLSSGLATIRSPHEIMETGDSHRSMRNPSEPVQCTRLLSKDPKLKLQLFPIDVYTRKGMEKDDHNPHLELTVGARKKISSIVEHLNRKWGNSSIASGELVLFPYAACQDNITSHHRWTLKDSFISAADVYAALGCPAVFRLRYGWFSSTGPGIGSWAQSSCHLGVCLHSDKENLSTNTNFTSVKKLSSFVNKEAEAVNKNGSTLANTNRAISVAFGEVRSDESDFGHATKNPDASSSCLPDNDGHPMGISSLKNSLQTPSEHPSTPWLGEDSTDGFLRCLFQNAENVQTGGGGSLATVEWADSLTNYSLGDFLAETSNGADAALVEQSAVTSSGCLDQAPFCSDSFDAAIAAHISRHQNAISVLANVWPSSIWDADDTRDAFSFQKNRSSQENSVRSSRNASMEKSDQNIFLNTTGEAEVVEEIDDRGEQPSVNVETDLQSMKENQGNENNCGISDIYWPDSLGCMIDLGLSSSRFQSQCLLNADSVSSLSGLIASSLDAFQNCSFFGTEKRIASCEGAQTQIPNSVALGNPVILDQSKPKISDNPASKLVDAISLGT